MKIKSVGSQAGGCHCHKGDVVLFIVDIVHLSTIAAQTGFGFKNFGKFNMTDSKLQKLYNNELIKV